MTGPAGVTAMSHPIVRSIAKVPRCPANQLDRLLPVGELHSVDRNPCLWMAIDRQIPDAAWADEDEGTGAATGFGGDADDSVAVRAVVEVVDERVADHDLPRRVHEHDLLGGVDQRVQPERLQCFRARKARKERMIPEPLLQNEALMRRVFEQRVVECAGIAEDPCSFVEACTGSPEEADPFAEVALRGLDHELTRQRTQRAPPPIRLEFGCSTLARPAGRVTVKASAQGGHRQLCESAGKVEQRLVVHDPREWDGVEPQLQVMQAARGEEFAQRLLAQRGIEEPDDPSFVQPVAVAGKSADSSRDSDWRRAVRSTCLSHDGRVAHYAANAPCGCEEQAGSEPTHG